MLISLTFFRKSFEFITWCSVLSTKGDGTLARYFRTLYQVKERVCCPVYHIRFEDCDDSYIEEVGDTVPGVSR